MSSPTRTACFQPDNYQDLSLFANRSILLSDLTEMLGSFIEPGAPREGRILIRGRRGVGKSMLSRKAIDELRHKYGPLIVTVDGQHTGHGPESFLRELAKDLAKETLENALDDELVKSAELLLRLGSATEVTVKQVQQWQKTLKIGLNLNHRFTDLVGLEFGMQRVSGKTRKLEQTYNRRIDVDLLRELIQALVHDCHRTEQPVVLLLDNLDQVGYAEREEDVRRVMDLARHLLSLKGCLVVANLRSEFVSADLRKSSSLSREIGGFAPDELMELFDKRVQVRGDEIRDKLQHTGFVAIARELSSWTDNGWGFLRWLMFLDYERIDFTAEDTEKLRDALCRFAEQNYAGVRIGEMERLARPYADYAQGFLTKHELTSSSDGSIDEELIERAVRYGVLVPDWLLEPDRYSLSPTLCFLTR